MEERMRPNILSSPRPLWLVVCTAILVVLGSGSTAVSAAKLAWRHLTPGGGPGKLWGQKAVYDRIGQRMLMVGGAVNGTDTISDTLWALAVGASDPTWGMVSHTAPERFDCSVGFDTPRRRIILYGGEDGSDGIHDQTFWADTAGSWTDVSGSVGPPPCARYQGAMVYDSRHSCMVLHGGSLRNSGGDQTYDTWELPMGSSWSSWVSKTKTPSTCLGADSSYIYPFGPCSPSIGVPVRFCGDLPTPRAWHAMAFDSTADKVLLDEGWYSPDFGGSGDGPGNEVWMGNYNSSYDWSLIEGRALSLPHQGPARMKHAIDFDTRDQQFVMVGGLDASNSPTAEIDTMSSAGQVWAAVTDSLTPPARDWHAMVYDPDWGRVLVFGGHLASGQADNQLYEVRFNDGPTIRPAPIVMGSTPTIVSGGVTLGWTDTGADSLQGRPVKYDLRYSTTRITGANFGSSTPDTLVGTPNWPGTAQSFTVTGLSPSTGYYFAIKAQDAWGNWSAISNVDSVCTDSSGIRPAAITLNGEDEGGYQSADLWWYSVGADSLSCPATAYDLRKSQSSITTGNFGSATQVSGLPTPAAPGTLQTMHVPSLGNCHLWYFAIKVRDSWGNWSAMSNVFSATTICFGEGTKPTDAMPIVLALGAPRPSPTAAGTTLRYDIPLKNGGDRFELGIYDVRGRLVKTLRHDAAVPGTFTLAWDRATNDGPRARPGIYFIRMSVGDERRTQTLILQ
jgi:hypothetical protein